MSVGLLLRTWEGLGRVKGSVGFVAVGTQTTAQSGQEGLREDRQPLPTVSVNWGETAETLDLKPPWAQEWLGNWELKQLGIPHEIHLHFSESAASVDGLFAGEAPFLSGGGVSHPGLAGASFYCLRGVLKALVCFLECGSYLQQSKCFNVCFPLANKYQPQQMSERGNNNKPKDW